MCVCPQLQRGWQPNPRRCALPVRGDEHLKNAVAGSAVGSVGACRATRAAVVRASCLAQATQVSDQLLKPIMTGQDLAGSTERAALLSRSGLARTAPRRVSPWPAAGRLAGVDMKRAVKKR